MENQPKQNNDLLDSKNPPNCKVNTLFLNAITDAIDKAGLTREAVISRMNQVLGGNPVITTSQLNKWLAPGTTREFPMTFLPALCWAVKSVSIVDVLLQPVHFKAVDERGQRLQLAAQYLLEAKALTQKAESMMGAVNAE